MSCSDSGSSASNAVRSTLTPDEGETIRSTDSTRQSADSDDKATLSQSVQNCCAEMSPSEYKKMTSKPTGTAENFLPSLKTENGSISRETAAEYEHQQGSAGGSSSEQDEPAAASSESSGTNTETAETRTAEEYDFNQGVTKEQREPAENRAEVKSQGGQPGDNSAEVKPAQKTMSQASSERVTTDPDGNKVTEFTADPQHRTKETRFYDNKHEAQSETEFSGRPDGIVKETQYLNKKESVHKDGTKATEYEPGDRRNPDPFIRKVTENANRKTTTFENRPDEVTSITEYNNSKSGLEKATHYKDGASELRYRDGTVKTRDSKGLETVSNPRMEAIARAASRPVNSKDADGNFVTEFKNDSQHRTKETRFYDNKQRNGAQSETEFSGRADGVVRETQYLNRTESLTQNGTKITEFTPGDRRNPDPFVRKITENAHRKTVTFENHPEGLLTTTDYTNQPSGLEKATRYKDGRSEYQYKDGTIKTTSSDGTQTVRNPRAEAEAEAATKPILSSRRDSGGNEVTDIKNDPEKRSRVTKFYDNKPRDGAQSETEFNGRADGLVKETQYLNRTEKSYTTGGKLTTYEAGDRRNPDPFVRTVWEPGSGKFKTTTYENHPDKIAEMTELKNHPQGLQQQIQYTDGSTERRFQDGTVKIKPRNGVEIVRPGR